MINNFARLLSFSSLAMLCTFLFQTYATHVMSPVEYGVLARWLTDLNYFGLFLVFGLDNAILYFSKEYQAYSENIIRNLMFFFTAGLILFIGFWLSNHLNWYVSYLLLSIVVFASFQSLNAYNQLREMYLKYGAFVLLRPLLLLLMLIGVASSYGGELDAEEIVVGYTLVGLALALVVGVSTLISSGVAWPKRIISAEYISYGGKSMFNTLLAVSLYTSTIYCIDYLLGKEAVGYFFVASAVAKLVWVLPDAVGNVMYPRFLKIDKEYSKNKIMAEAYRLSRIVVVLNFLAVVVFALLGGWFVSMIFGDEFVESTYPIILILLVGNQGMVLYKILGRYLASINYWRIMHVALAASVAVNVGLNFLLTPVYGVIGSAIATSFAFWVCGLIVSYKVPGSFQGFFGIHKLFKDV